MQIELPLHLRLMSFIFPRSHERAQYTIYAYHSYEGERVGHNHWERLSTSQNRRQSLLRAQALYRSNRYQKIEVKKKIYDAKTGMHTDSLYRVYQNESGRNYFAGAMIVLMLLIGAGLFYLNHI